MSMKIDFVLIWVDGNDPEWKASFQQYISLCNKGDDHSVIRYRDWDNLKYWFRGVEKFAPWVNKIHFVTCSHLPNWLNVNAKKINIVKHSDYIKSEYLPTFSAFPIELNLHRIKDLSEHFVFFNDDFFIIDKVEPERFFKNGLPCDSAALNAISPLLKGITHNVVNDIMIINSHFKKYDVLKNNITKWFNYKYGIQSLRTLALFPWPYFTGFYDHHFPSTFLKSTFEEVWRLNENKLRETTASRFRSMSDVNQWLFRYWQLVKGNFYPINVNSDSIFFEIKNENIDMIIKTIERKRKKIIVLNDVTENIDFSVNKELIKQAFETILSEKSSFEI